MSKVVRGEKIRGEKLIYEKTKEEDVCLRCHWNLYGCLIYKYRRNPEICKSIRKMIADEPTKHYISPNQKETSVVEILSYWNCDTKEKRFRYAKITSILDCNGWRIISVRKTTLGEYQRFLDKKAREKAKKAHTLLAYIAPINPW